MAWSKELKDRTKNTIFPGAIVKDEQWNFGVYFPESDGSIILRGVDSSNHIPVSTDEIIAVYENKEAMIAAGWVMD